MGIVSEWGKRSEQYKRRKAAKVKQRRLMRGLMRDRRAQALMDPKNPPDMNRVFDILRGTTIRGRKGGWSAKSLTSRADRRGIRVSPVVPAVQPLEPADVGRD